MEENNNTQENGSIFGNMNSLDDEPKKDLYEGLDSDTFGKAADAAKVQDATEDQNATVHTSDWNSDVYVPGGQTSYYNAEMPAPEKKQSKALEICALVFGILSLCGCCYGLFGMIGLVLSIVALVTGKKSGLSITGLILSIIGIVGALAWTIFCFSSAGQEWSSTITKSFMEGFEEGYNSTYENGSTEIESDEATDNENDETEEFEINISENTSLKNETVGKVIIDGKEITIPCKFSEIKSEFEISDESKEALEGGLEAYDLEIVSLMSDGKSTGISVVISNNSDTDITDINDVYVTGISMDSYGEITSDVKFFNDIIVGMSKKDLETALNGLAYAEEAGDGYVYYSFCSGENSDFSVSICVIDDKVEEVMLSCYGECE